MERGRAVGLTNINGLSDEQVLLLVKRMELYRNKHENY